MGTPRATRRRQPSGENMAGTIGTESIAALCVRHDEQKSRCLLLLEPLIPKHWATYVIEADILHPARMNDEGKPFTDLTERNVLLVEDTLDFFPRGIALLELVLAEDASIGCVAVGGIPQRSPVRPSDGELGRIASE